MDAVDAVIVVVVAVVVVVVVDMDVAGKVESSKSYYMIFMTQNFYRK